MVFYPALSAGAWCPSGWPPFSPPLCAFHWATHASPREDEGTRGFGGPLGFGVGNLTIPTFFWWHLSIYPKLSIRIWTCSKAVQIFENILGAWLNANKLVIVPLMNPHPQSWHKSIGCIILNKIDTTVYHGCLFGFHVTPLQETKFLLGKVQKCLFHWANRCLSFSGQIFLLKTCLICHPYLSLHVNVAKHSWL